MSTISGMKIDSVEVAYGCLASCVLEFVASRSWDASGMTAQVTTGSVTLSNYWLQRGGAREERAEGWRSSKILRSATESVRYLRDELLRNTGQRIWGLTFTLFPDGRFNIQYDYDRPLGYDETPETIDGDEINASLSNLIGRGKASE